MAPSQPVRLINFVEYSKTAIVATSGTTSAAVDLTNWSLLGFFTDAAFVGTTITFTASQTIGGTYTTVQNTHADSSAYTVTTTASQYVPIDNFAILAGLRYIKFVCTSTQTSGTTFTLAARPV